MIKFIKLNKLTKRRKWLIWKFKRTWWFFKSFYVSCYTSTYEQILLDQKEGWKKITRLKHKIIRVSVFDRNIAGPVFGQLSKIISLAVTVNWNEFDCRSFITSQWGFNQRWSHNFVITSVNLFDSAQRKIEGMHILISDPNKVTNFRLAQFLFRPYRPLL